MNVIKLMIVALALSVASTAMAQSPLKGEAAPDFGTPKVVYNAPSEISFEALRGEVILIKQWGTR